MLNPLATIFQQFRHAIINHAAPGAAAILGTGGVLVVVAIVFAGVRARLCRVQPDRAVRSRESLIRSWLV